MRFGKKCRQVIGNVNANLIDIAQIRIGFADKLGLLHLGRIGGPFCSGG